MGGLAGLVRLAFVVALAGCDQGPRDDAPKFGRTLVLVDTNARPGQPVACDGFIELEFNRLLLPSTVVRQSILLQDSAGESARPPVVVYDPLRKRVRLDNPNVLGGQWLSPGQFYRITLPVPSGPDDFGLRAIDGTPLDGTSAIELGFFAGPAVGERPRTNVDYCEHIAPMLASRCGGTPCHGASPSTTLSPESSRIETALPAAGLLLDSASGLQITAIGKVTRGTASATRSGIPTPGARLFGVDMPLIDPGNPANSYLLYKTMMAAPGTTTSATSCRDGSPAAHGEDRLTESDRTELSSRLAGAAMPLHRTSTAPSEPLSPSDREALRLWIEGGAATDPCGTCERAHSSDGGAP